MYLNKKSWQDVLKFIHLPFESRNNICICLYFIVFIKQSNSIITRILFHNYKFLFIFTLFFFEQFLSMLLFLFLKRNINIIIDLSIFWKNKYFYIVFSIIYFFNVIFVFYGHKLVLNVSMYFTLKKLALLILFLNDYFISKKKIGSIAILSIVLILIGSILVAKDSFTNDFTGYVIVLISNILTVIYCKMTELYHKMTGFKNIQLLIYNNYLTLPILFLCILFTGEFKKVYY